MPTPLLITIATLAEVGQIVFSPYGSKPWWMDVLFVIGMDSVLALLMYAAAGRFDDWKGIIPGLATSTKKGLIGIAYMGVIALLIAAVSGLLVGPALWDDTPSVDWGVFRMWPTFVFIDASIIIYRRWRDDKKVEQLNQYEQNAQQVKT